jgi:hypothetical protein
VAITYLRGSAGEVIRQRNGNDLIIFNDNPRGKFVSHILEFEFETPDYFTEDNSGHFAVGVRGYVNQEEWVPQGAGVIIGNVTAYPGNGPCKPARKKNVVAIENFFRNGNCVHGGGGYSDTPFESPQLKNSKRYKIRIGSYYAGGTTGYLTQYVLWEHWSGKEIGRATIVDDGYNIRNLAGLLSSDSPDYSLRDYDSAPRENGGWFIGEVFSDHYWTFHIYNLKYSEGGQLESSVCANKVPVYTSWLNDGRHDRYLTTSPFLYKSAIETYGYQDAGIVSAYVEPSYKAFTVPLRSYYSSTYQNHILSYSDNAAFERKYGFKENDHLLKNGWVKDGALGYVYTIQVHGTTRLYRLWKNHNNSNDLEHRHTIDKEEAIRLQEEGWNYDDTFIAYVCDK